ncbi:hypothetical protein ABBQ32_003390 [Trebouxia sp. C0010 RCD-2024]
MQDLEEVSLSAAPHRWSKDRCRNCLAKVVSCLKGYEGWWVSRSVAREQVHKVIGDTGMMDFMLKAIANRTIGPWAVFRRTIPNDRDRMLFYLLIMKDGSTVLPAPDAVHPDFASPSLPTNTDSKLPHSAPVPASAAAAAAAAATPAVVNTEPQQQDALQPLPPSATPAAEADGQETGHQAVATSLTSEQVFPACPDEQPVHASSAILQPKLSVQRGLQQAAACNAGLNLSGSNTDNAVLQPSAESVPAFGHPLVSPPAVAASPQLSCCPPQPVMPHSAPALSQLQPSLPQLQPSLPQLEPSPPRLHPLSPSSSAQPIAAPHTAELGSQQTHQQLQGEYDQASQDISKEFLALLQETSTHLAVGHPAWSGPTGSEPMPAQTQSVDCKQAAVETSPIENWALKLCDATAVEGQSSHGKAADTVTGSGSQKINQNHQAPAGPVSSPKSPSRAASSAASPAALPAPSPSHGLKGLLGDAFTSIIAQRQARRTPSFTNAASLQSSASPQITPVSVSQTLQHSPTQFAASLGLQPLSTSSHASLAAPQIPSRQQQKQQHQAALPHQQQHAVLSSSNGLQDAGQPPQTALEPPLQSTHRALFGQRQSNWPEAAAWSGHEHDSMSTGKHPGTAWQHEQQQPSATVVSGQFASGGEGWDDQLSDHNMWSQYLNSHPEPESASVSQHVTPPNHPAQMLVQSTNQSACPQQLVIPEAGRAPAQRPPLSITYLPEHTAQQVPAALPHATTTTDDAAEMAEEQDTVTRERQVQNLPGMTSMDAPNTQHAQHAQHAQHEASLQAQLGTDVTDVEADSTQQAAAVSFQDGESEGAAAVEITQQPDSVRDVADGTDTQHQNGTDIRSELQQAEPYSSSLSHSAQSHHHLQADCAMADAEDARQNLSRRPSLSDVQGINNAGVPSDEAQHPQHLSADALERSNDAASEAHLQASDVQTEDTQHAQQATDLQTGDSQHAQQASDMQAEEPQHPQQASCVQAEDSEHAQQASDVQTGKPQHSQQATDVCCQESQKVQQASDVEMDDVQQTSDLPTQEARQAPKASDPDSSQAQRAQQGLVGETQERQQMTDVDGAVAHAQHASDPQSLGPQQVSDSALQEAQHAQQAPDVHMEDAQPVSDPALLDWQPGKSEHLPLQPRRSLRGKGPAQDPPREPASEPATSLATDITARQGREPTAAPSHDQEGEAVGPPPTTRSSTVAKQAPGKTRSAKPVGEPSAVQQGPHKAASKLDTHKMPGTSIQQPVAKRSHKKQAKRQRLTLSEEVGQQLGSNAAAGGTASAGKQAPEALDPAMGEAKPV